MTYQEEVRAPDDAFEFGQNWQAYVEKHLDPERIKEAEKSLLDFAGEDCIQGKTFLDIGCGSGLFSLAAHNLGAAKVVSFDVDKNSVRCCEQLQQMTSDSSSWVVETGSILDASFIQKLNENHGPFDFVYSWGVLHHTGAMWQAIENAASLVSWNGKMFIAIYNNADGFQFTPDGRIGNSRLWLIEKKLYVHAPYFVQKGIDFFAMVSMLLVYLLLLRNPLKQIHSHKSLRGMSWSIDIRDWLGGYPYEYARADEIFNFVRPLGFQLENLKVNNGLLNNEFLFARMTGG